MKTILPSTISTEQQAVDFLTMLHNNGEAFHPEDNAHDIEWGNDDPPTPDQCDKLNSLMEQIYDLGTVDPCAVLLELLPIEE